jgi:hypothetical protein
LNYLNQPLTATAPLSSAALGDPPGANDVLQNVSQPGSVIGGSLDSILNEKYGDELISYLT